MEHRRLPLNPHHLHPYSKGFFDYLTIHRPGWLAHASAVPSDLHEQLDLEIELPHPAGAGGVGPYGREAEPIVIWMNDGVELTVEWDPIMHAHMGMERSGAQSDPALDYAEGVAMIDDIMAEQLVIIEASTDDRHAYGWCLAVELIDEVLVEDIRTHPDVTLFEVRSWLGTHDRRLHP